MGAGTSKLKAKPGIVVTLDALGTIYRPREPIATQYIKVAQRCGLKAQIDPDELNRAFRKSFKALSAEYPNYGKGQLPSPRAWWKTVTEDAFRQVVAESEIPSHLNEELFDHFKSSAAYELYPDVKPFFAIMRELKESFSDPYDPPIFVGVISNSDPRVKSVLQSLALRVGLDKEPSVQSVRQRLQGPPQDLSKSPWYDAYNPSNDIDFLTTSYTVGSEKPAGLIFEKARQYAGLVLGSRIEQSEGDQGLTWQTMKTKLALPAQVTAIYDSSFIHIGDDYRKDYMGAQAVADFEALHLVRDGEGSAVDGAQTVRSLVEAATSIRLLVDMNLRTDQE